MYKLKTLLNNQSTLHPITSYFNHKYKTLTTNHHKTLSTPGTSKKNYYQKHFTKNYKRRLSYKLSTKTFKKNNKRPNTNPFKNPKTTPKNTKNIIQKKKKYPLQQQLKHQQFKQQRLKQQLLNLIQKLKKQQQKYQKYITPIT